MNYIAQPTNNPLESGELYEGRTVCFSDVLTNPNNIGVLESSRRNGTAGVWKATINNTLKYFDKNGYMLDATGSIVTPNVRLYGVISNTLNITESQAITRSGGGTVTITGLIAKDQFALAAMEAIINGIPNPLAVDDGTIVLVATKAYKFAQAMLQVGSMARSADETGGSSSGSEGTVDVNNLSSNSEKLLNNIHKAIEALKSQQADVVTKLNEIKVQDAAKFTTGIKVDNPTNDEFDINGGGGDGVDAATLKAACENNINWSTLPGGNNTMVSVVGFYKKNDNGAYIVMENSIATLMTRLEEAEDIAANNSVWYWLRHAPGGVTITDITSFLTAYAQNIWGELQDSVDSRGNTNLASNGAWYNAIAAIADARIAVKVKAESLNS